MSDQIISSDPSVTSDEQIITMLREDAGVNPPEGASRKDLMKLARSAGFRIDEPSPKKLDEAAAATKSRRPKSYVIEITSTKDKPHVIVGVNGVISQIKCDTPVTVKPEVVEVLRNARKDVYDDVKDDLGRVVQRNRRSVPEHAVTIHEINY